MSTPSVAIPAVSASERRLSQRARTAVAVAGAVVVGLCFARFGLSGHAGVGSIFAVTRVYLAAFDLEHRLIPRRVVLPATTVVLALNIAIYPPRTVAWLAA